ncbi:response regulator transcription factor [Dinghuibacter silviterrae]|nr:helix-turn-helix transcriptional regulator [Dinghuibacter silviterrae]
MPYDVDTPYVRYTIHEHAILEASYKEDVLFITKEMAREIVAKRLALQKGQSYRLLMHAENRIHMSPAARNYFTGPEGNKGIAAVAILYDNWTQNMVTRFILLIKKPDFPMETFRDSRKAKNWLLKQDLRGIAPIIRINPAITKYGLSEKDIEIMRCMAQGLNSKEIGEELDCSPRTVEFLKNELYGKLSAVNGCALIQRANDLDLIGKNAY